MQDDPSADSKLTRTKRSWADAGKFLTGTVARRGDDRLPPGQHRVNDWPVLDLGTEPKIPPSGWRLDVTGLVANPLSLTWAAFEALPQSRVTSDIHCVTTWSRYDNDWQGVRIRDLLDQAEPSPEAHFVMLSSHDGYTTNLPLADFADEAALLATHWQGKPLTSEHGGPMRAVIPHLYFWKSAKWLRSITLTATDAPGFWERNGYHMYGDPWREQRYSKE